MKRSTLILFVIGVLLEGAALMLAYPTRFPFVLKVISSDCEKGKQALQLLDNRKPLVPDSPGFPVIEKILLARLKNVNPPEVFDKVKITKITRTKTIVRKSFMTQGEVNIIPLEVRFSNGQKYKWDLVKLRQEVADLQEEDFFMAALILFNLGVLIQIVGLVLEARDNRKEQAAQPTERQVSSEYVPSTSSEETLDQ